MNRAQQTIVAGGLVGLVGLIALAPASASAQAWTRDQGKGYVNLSVTRLSGDEIFGTDGQSRTIANTYTQTILGVYAELGLIDRWLTVSLSSEVFRRNALDDLAATQGLGDIQVGAWSGLLDGPFRLTVGVVLGIPTGDDQPSPDDNADLDAELAANSLPTGDGEFDITPTVVIGYAFGGQSWPLRHFVTARAVGYWLRTRGLQSTPSPIR